MIELMTLMLVSISHKPFHFLLYLLQDEIAFKQKQREEKKKLEEMKQKASQKGPLGNARISFVVLI